jgi:hypothetical protein
VLLAPGGCHSNLRFFTRGPVIGGESISLRAFAVINQTAVFLTGGSSPVLVRFPLPFGVKELGKKIKIKIRDAAMGFFTIAAKPHLRNVLTRTSDCRTKASSVMPSNRPLHRRFSEHRFPLLVYLSSLGWRCLVAQNWT